MFHCSYLCFDSDNRLLYLVTGDLIDHYFHFIFDFINQFSFFLTINWCWLRLDLSTKEGTNIKWLCRRSIIFLLVLLAHDHGHHCFHLFLHISSLRLCQIYCRLTWYHTLSSLQLYLRSLYFTPFKRIILRILVSRRLWPINVLLWFDRVTYLVFFNEIFKKFTSINFSRIGSTEIS